tara:strand:- start:84 stop:569 length:486 start_codon:yes stop_codon:yes gene_type:complete
VRLNKKLLGKINVSGKGGAEKLFLTVLSEGWERVSQSLYDFVNRDTKRKMELKKQANQQWFDVWKYHNLSDDDRQILMTFLVHKDGIVDYVWSIALGDMIDTLLSDDEYTKDGWTSDNLADEYKKKQLYPGRQSKSPLKVKKFVEKYTSLGTFHYQKAVDI